MAVLKSQRGHRIVADTGGEHTERAINRRMRVATDNDLAWSPQPVLDDHVMQTAIASVEEILDSVLRRESPDLVQRTGGLFGSRRKIVIEHEGNA